NAPALAVLKGLKRSKTNPHVLPGSARGKHYTGVGHAWTRIRRAAGIEDVHLHDLRHTFGATAAAAGKSLLLIGAVVGHTSQAPAMRSAHVAPRPAHEVAEDTGARLARALAGKTPKDNVREMKRPRRR